MYDFLHSDMTAGTAAAVSAFHFVDVDKCRHVDA